MSEDAKVIQDQLIDVRDYLIKEIQKNEMLQKENAELRECLKKMVLVAENRMPKRPTLLEVEYINDAKAALEGVNHAND